MLSGRWEIDELRVGGELFGCDGEVALKGHRECLECLDVYCRRSAPTHKCKPLQPQHRQPASRSRTREAPVLAR